MIFMEKLPFDCYTVPELPPSRNLLRNCIQINRRIWIIGEPKFATVYVMNNCIKLHQNMDIFVQPHFDQSVFFVWEI